MSWRWTFGVVSIISALSLVPVAILPETSGPVILRKRAVELREKDLGRQIYAPIEMQNRGAREIVTETLALSSRMLFGEPIVFFNSLYLAFASAIYCKFLNLAQHALRNGFHD